MVQVRRQEVSPAYLGMMLMGKLLFLFIKRYDFIHLFYVKERRGGPLVPDSVHVRMFFATVEYIRSILNYALR